MRSGRELKQQRQEFSLGVSVWGVESNVYPYPELRYGPDYGSPCIGNGSEVELKISRTLVLSLLRITKRENI